MPKLDEQIKTLAGYFAADCEPDGKLSRNWRSSTSLTRSDGQPPAFADVQGRAARFAAADRRADHHRRRIFRLQRPGADGHAGARVPAAHQPGPLRDAGHHGSVQTAFYLQLGLALAAHGRAWTAGCHPTCHAEDLPLVPRTRTRPWTPTCGKGACSVQMMRHGGDACVH